MSDTPDDGVRARPAGQEPAGRARSLLLDVRVLRIAFQMGVLAVVAGLLFWLNDNLGVNLRSQDLDLSFDYLDRQAGFSFAYSPFSPADSILGALLAGLRNTIIVAAVGMVLTLIFGTLIGVGRLSSNWLVRKAAGVYVETFRNLPPLLVVLFTNTVLLLSLPTGSMENATEVGDWLVLSVRGIGLVSPQDGGDLGTYLVLLVIAAVVVLAVGRWRGWQEARTGQPARRWAWCLAPWLATAAVGYVALGGPISLSHPRAVPPSQIAGGTALALAYVAVLIGLVLYTSSHVAEIVRGSILAVPTGQNEAATAIGLTSAQRLRYVVLPQAFRVAVPPLINQGLNLTKNTSLGVVVGYAEVMYVAETVVGNNSPAIQTYLVVMGMYLVLSLLISAVGNVANWRLRQVDR